MFLHSTWGASDTPRGGGNDLQRHQSFCGNFCVGIVRACARNWGIVWMYPSHLLQLCDAIRARLGNFFVVMNICALSSVCTSYTPLLVNVVLSLQGSIFFFNFRRHISSKFKVSL